MRATPDLADSLKGITQTTLLVENVLYWVCAGVFTPFLSAYFTRNGLTASEVGLVLTCLPACSLLAQPFWSYLADRFSCRRQLLVGLSIAAAVTAPLLSLGSAFVPALFFTLLFSVFFQALMPLCDSLVIDVVVAGGFEFSRVRMGGTVGYAVVVALIGRALEWAPMIQFFAVSIALVVFAVWTLRIPDPAAGHVAAAPGSSSSPRAQVSMPAQAQVSRPKASLLSVFDTNQIVPVLLFAFVSYVGLGFHGSFIGRLVVQSGHGQELVGILSAVSALSEVPILLVSDRLVERFGEINLLAFACFAIAARLLLVGTEVVWVMVVAQLLQSVSYMTAYYSAVTYIARHVMPGAEARGQSILAMVQAGLATVCANLLGGVLIDSFGIAQSFRLFAAFTFVAAVAVIAFSTKGVRKIGA